MNGIQRPSLLFVLLLHLVTNFAYVVHDNPNPDDFIYRLVTELPEDPTNFVFLPDGRVLVAMKDGTVRILTTDGLLPDPWIDISDLVNNAGDRGLIGSAVHPQFAQGKPYLYLLFTQDPVVGYPEEPAEQVTQSQLVRITEDPTTKKGDIQSLKVLIGEEWGQGIPNCHNSHAIGDVQFGMDGTLLISTGDGAHWDTVDDGKDFNQYDSKCQEFFGDEQDVGVARSQLQFSLAGKILRIDPETGEGIGGDQYPGFISNPFYEDSDPKSAESRVWSLGLRNPFRFTVRTDNRASDPQLHPGSVYVGDVGWEYWEEVNVARDAGYNFGWPCYQGPEPDGVYNNPGRTQKLADFCSTNIPTLPEEAKSPLILYHHINVSIGEHTTGFIGNAIAGAAIYTGDQYPARFQGTPNQRAVFFADFGKKWIRTFWVNDKDEMIESLGVEHFALDIGNPVAIKTHPSTGDLWVLTIYPPELRVFEYKNAPNQANTSDIQVSLAYSIKSIDRIQNSIQIQFSSDNTQYIQDSYQPLQYAWDFGDASPGSDSPNPVHSYPISAQNFTVTLTVTYQGQSTVTKTARLLVPAQVPPVVKIIEPTRRKGFQFEKDQEVTFVVDVQDYQQNTLDPQDLLFQWEFWLIHNNHIHRHIYESNNPLTLTAILSNYISYLERNMLEVHVTVTDKRTGLSSEEFIRCEPKEAENHDPVAVLQIRPQSGDYAVRHPITFNAAQSTDQDQDLLYSNWFFGDGLSASATSILHAYDTPGTYQVRLNVTDAYGATATITEKITVTGDDGEDINSHLLLYYKFDTLKRDAKTGNYFTPDSSPHRHKGKVVGQSNPQVSNGHDKKALFFNGNQLINAGEAIRIEGDMTLMFWVKMDVQHLQTNSFMRIISCKADYDELVGWEFEYNPYFSQFSILGSGGINMTRGNYTLDDNWHHVAAVVKGNVGQIFVDGNEATVTGLSAIDPIVVPPPNRALHIGSQLAVFPSVTGFRGSLDNLRLYAVALSPPQIRTILVQEC